MMAYLKKNFITILLSVILVIGIGLLAYPTVSDYYNSFHQSRAIASYEEEVADMDTTRQEAMLEEARAYNRTLVEEGTSWNLSPEQQKIYDSTLDVSGTGIMGYVEIEKIHCSLPIYHGTDDAVLQIAIGHLPGSSLPVGGESTHTVLSGHRGLPSAKLFTNIDDLEEGDTFVLRVLGESLVYEVDQILIVLPDELSALNIEEGKDLCTLVTCTPYGINTHRLLVRGHRVENSGETETLRVSADGIQIEPVIVTPLAAAPILLLLFIISLSGNRKEKRKAHRDKDQSEKKGR